jgi:ketosteroid isomerase-like protein
MRDRKNLQPSPICESILRGQEVQGMKWVIRLALCSAVGAGAAAEANLELREQVRQAELAFAKTMADRDHAAFATFVSEEAVFFGRSGAQRGKGAVVAAWKGLYEGPQAPFSWAPDTVEVLDSGTLALSSGPVVDPTGVRTGTFQSIWRRESDGSWRVIFDKGADYCPPREKR